MGRDDPKLIVRMPVELKAWLAATAVLNRRSQNAEIVVRLEAARAAESAADGGENPAAGQGLRP